MRETIDVYTPALEPDGAGGMTVSADTLGELLLSANAEVTVLKPSREQLATQARFGQTIKVRLWARKGVTLSPGNLLYWRDKAYTLQGAPVENALRTEWTLYAQTDAA